MSIEEHHKFILDTMDRQNAIARKFVAELEAENERLKAEVERLTPLLGDIVPFDEYHKLLQQVERLTKAGYAMAVKINVHGINDRFTDSQKLVDDWSNAAREGKGQP